MTVARGRDDVPRGRSGLPPRLLCVPPVDSIDPDGRAVGLTDRSTKTVRLAGSSTFPNQSNPQGPCAHVLLRSIQSPPATASAAAARRGIHSRARSRRRDHQHHDHQPAHGGRQEGSGAAGEGGCVVGWLDCHGMCGWNFGSIDRSARTRAAPCKSLGGNRDKQSSIVSTSTFFSFFTPTHRSGGCPTTSGAPTATRRRPREATAISA